MQDFEDILEMFEDYKRDPRPMDQEPRNMELAKVQRSEMDNFNTPDLDQGADSILKPGETLDDFDVTFRKPNAEGGRQGFAEDNKLVKKLIPLDKTKLDAANLKRVQDSVNELYEKHTKEYVDNAAKEWAKKSNLEKNRKRKIKIQNLDEMEISNDRANFKVKFKDDIKKYGEWNPDRKSSAATKRYANNVKRAKTGTFETIVFDAFGRADIKGTNKPNPNYNLQKLKAIHKNIDEYKILKKYLKTNFGIVTQLDHPLDKNTLRTIMNASAADLTNVNILEQNLNDGFKKQLNNKYFQAVDSNNLVQKRAVEKIAKQFKLNLGSVPDGSFFDVSKINRGVDSFETLNIKDEMLKSLKNASNLDTKWGKYIKDNPVIFKDAGFNLKTLKKPPNVANITKNLPEIKKKLQVIAKGGGAKAKAATTALSVITSGAVGYNIEKILKGTGLMDKEYELTASAKDAPIVETKFTTGEKAAAAGAASLVVPAVRKVAGTVLNAAGVPLSLGINAAIGIDPKSSFDRTLLAGELALAPGVVQGATSVTDKIKNPLVKKIAQTLAGIRIPGLMNPANAMKIARYASPVGMGLMGLEAVYNVGKLGYQDQKRFNALSPEEQQAERAEQEEFAQSVEGAAEGGIMGLKKND